ncbi:hypothetical protein H3Z85_14050 [Chryseobacterium indologenes]|uniref:hypothetical protein n=1 Tax=Chryseobacterium TaxID=59732 RepID=UPI0004BCD563|nr:MULTISPECIES: hypothetical protein [Chryseobacterium]QIX79826.1 hypothetical protein FOB56_00495 [Chryseobacterium indologenes]QPQ50570.1 hypothetical protein H3Z85_14050 [Chryseobacterium indologenes]UDQ53460.1 hypothetical protein LJF28_18780 [Chryseobacterium indologenes]
MKNSNLKKLNRNQQKQISGAERGLQKCTYPFECPGGSCCFRVCISTACPDL